MHSLWIYINSLFFCSGGTDKSVQSAENKNKIVAEVGLFKHVIIYSTKLHSSAYIFLLKNNHQLPFHLDHVCLMCACMSLAHFFVMIEKKCHKMSLEHFPFLCQ